MGGQVISTALAAMRRLSLPAQASQRSLTWRLPLMRSDSMARAPVLRSPYPIGLRSHTTSDSLVKHNWLVGLKSARLGVRPAVQKARAAQSFSSGSAGTPPWPGSGGGGNSGDGGGKLPGDTGDRPQQEAVLPESSATPASADEVLVLDVGGMHCGGCVRRVKRLLEEHDSVLQASVNLSTEIALAEVRLPSGNGTSEAKERLRQLAQELAQILQSNGFKATARDGKEGSSAIKNIIEGKRQERVQRLHAAGKRLVVAWVLASACWAGHLAHILPHAPAWLHVLGSVPVHAAMSALALLGPGRQILADGWQAARRRSPDMNSLVALGACSSFAVSCAAAALPALGWRTFFEEPAMLLGVVLVGRTLEERAKLQASSDMTALQALLPETARLEVGNGASWKTVPASVVSPGNVVRVLPGDCIPADGKVVRGRSSVDESALTGEPMPVVKMQGSTVTAGTVNCDGSLSILVQKSGEATAMADIVKSVESAQAHAAPIQRVADIVAGRFALGVMAASAATFVFWGTLGPSLFPQAVAKFGSAAAGAKAAGLLLSLQLACNVLVVACPCALGLAAPTAVLVGTSAAARRGLLIRGGDILEATSHVDTVIFDKTGTLTLGKPSIVEVRLTDEGHSKADVLARAAAVERYSSHPLAKAIVSAADAEGAESLSAEEDTLQQESGSGIVGQVNGTSVAVGNLEWVNQHSSSSLTSLFQQGSGVPGLETSLARERIRGSDGASTSGHGHQGGDDLAPGHSAVYVSVDGRLAGVLHVADTLRPGAWETVQALRRKGLQVGLLSGDQPAAARYVAQALGIEPDQVFAGVKPEGKAELVGQLRQQGHCVAMVGDGINDAAALATADVGIAMGGGVGAASQVASIVLLGDRLPQVVDAIHTSQATFRKIRQNLGWAFAYNLVAIPVAAGALLPSAGIALTPSLAGAMMGVSSLAVMLNSLMLQWERPQALPQHPGQAQPAAPEQAPALATAPGSSFSGHPAQQDRQLPV